MPYTKPFNRDTLYTHIRRWLLYAIVASLVFSRLWINSLCLLLFVAVWVAEGNFRTKWDLIRKDRVFLAYSLYFVVELIGLFFASNIMAGWKYTESKLGFLALPLIFGSTRFVDKSFRNDIFMALNISVTLASLYCLGFAIWNYSATHSPDVFFYHQLVSPLSHHAVYFSVFVFLGFVFLLQEGHEIPWLRSNKWLRALWLLYYLVLLVLLSSKMVLTVVVLFMIYSIFQRYWDGQKRSQTLALVVVLAGILICMFSVDNPVKKRFDDMLQGNVRIIEKEKYDQRSYFNGLQFRLLLWRLTYEILHDKKKWILGVGPSNAQAALREKYLSLNLYAGKEKSKDHGYLDFNAHNQFLQTALSSGLVGLAVLIWWCITLVRKALTKRSPLLVATVFIILCFFFSESVIDTQYGVVLCTIFPLLLIYTNEDKSMQKPVTNTLS